MSHTTIYFLTKASNFKQAEQQVTNFLENENFFDYFNIITAQSGPLEEKRPDLDAFIQEWDWKKTADDFLKMAEQYKASGNLDLYGYHLINAGQLYAQYLSADTYIFNIEESDYSVPSENENWWAIAVDFHY